jgi:hypothetical protein
LGDLTDNDVLVKRKKLVKGREAGGASTLGYGDVSRDYPDRQTNGQSGSQKHYKHPG